MSIYALDPDSNCSYKFYREQKEVIDEMCNRLVYNFTVTSAKRNDNRLLVTIKNTGLAPHFSILTCAEITDKDGNRLASFGEPIRIEEGSFHDEEEKTFLFEYDGTLTRDAIICLAMYDSDNPLVAGKIRQLGLTTRTHCPPTDYSLSQKHRMAMSMRTVNSM